MSIINETMKESELQAEIHMLRLRVHDLESELISHEALKRQAVAQKLKVRDNLENLIQYLVDHSENKTLETNITTLCEEFDFVDKYVKEAK